MRNVQIQLLRILLGWRKDGVKAPLPQYVPDEICHRVLGFCCRYRRERLRIRLEGALDDFLSAEVKEDVHCREGEEGLVDAE
jgi:hypothetical protein